MTYRQYVNLCVGNKDKTLKQDRFERDLVYYIIKGWADPKIFTISKERFRPLDGDDIGQIIMPTREELLDYDQRFRSIGSKKKWLE